jgi:hypothetical protein
MRGNPHNCERPGSLTLEGMLEAEIDEQRILVRA